VSLGLGWGGSRAFARVEKRCKESKTGEIQFCPRHACFSHGSSGCVSAKGNTMIRTLLLTLATVAALAALHGAPEPACAKGRCTRMKPWCPPFREPLCICTDPVRPSSCSWECVAL
jgi:hypothetical protein